MHSRLTLQCNFAHLRSCGPANESNSTHSLKNAEVMNIFQNVLEMAQTKEGLDFPRVVLDLDSVLRIETFIESLMHLEVYGVFSKLH